MVGMKDIKPDPLDYLGGRPVQLPSGALTGREFWLQVIVEFLACGAISNN